MTFTGELGSLDAELGNFMLGEIGTLVIAGPYYFVAADLFCPGAVRAVVYVAGAVAGQCTTE